MTGWGARGGVGLRGGQVGEVGLGAGAGVKQGR